MMTLQEHPGSHVLPPSAVLRPALRHPLWTTGLTLVFAGYQGQGSQKAEEEKLHRSCKGDGLFCGGAGSWPVSGASGLK